MNELSKRHSARASLVALACAALMAGCTSLGPTTVLEQPSDAAFRNADMLALRTSVRPSPELAAWWEGFEDPTLTRLVEAALTDNLDIAQAEARLTEADAMSRRADADRLPGGGARADVSRQRQSLEGPSGQIAQTLPGFGRTQTLFDTGVEARWEVDLFGKLGAVSRAARAGSAEADALLDGVRIRIAAETADAYLSLVGATERLAIIEDQLGVQRDLTSTASRRFDAGEAGVGELDEARADLARAEALVSDATIERERQANRLRVLTGGGEVTVSADRVPEAPVLSGLGTPAEVLRRRPDVRAAEARVAASDARIGSALAEYYPSVSLGGLIGLQALDADQVFTSSAANASGLLGLRWRLFDFPRIGAEVSAARARSDGSLAAYEATLLTATEEVENALFAVVARERQASDFARGETALRAATTASRRSYEAGLISLPDRLDIERRLLGVRQDEAAARLASARASVAAFRVVGGWIRTPERPVGSNLPVAALAK